MRVQFILKFRDAPGYADEHGCYSEGKTGLPSGLRNSAGFCDRMLREMGLDSEVVQVVDNNGIDREVARFRPDVVVVEGLWVVPEKFHVLVPLHPRVQWVVRNHSEMPFLANEGMALEWIAKYVRIENVHVATNSERSLRDLRHMLLSSRGGRPPGGLSRKLFYLPNHYPIDGLPKFHARRAREAGTVSIGCFGAIRPLKNNLVQAMAAMRYAEETGQHLRFYVNATRSEQGGANNLKNIRALFAQSKFELVEVGWMPPEAFVRMLATSIDLLLQVSFTETFNIVAADAVAAGIPVVVSKEIAWASPFARADPTDVRSIAEKIRLALDSPWRRLVHGHTRSRLKLHSERARWEWYSTLDLLCWWAREERS